MLCTPELRQAVAAHNNRFYGQNVDWQTEMIVTCGATASLTDCILALIKNGDEVVLIEALYDSHFLMVRRAGGVPKLVCIEPPDWELPRDTLADAFSSKTKMILPNSPQNPAAKVYSRNKHQFIADLVIKHDAYAICDEVYEHIVSDGAQHIPRMTLTDMRDRCVRSSSAGKTLSMTVWKVGNLTAPTDLMSAIAKAHQFVTLTTPKNLQRAVTIGVEQGDSYFAGLCATQESKRNRVRDALEDAGFKTLHTAGTFFLFVDIRSVRYEGGDVDFCEHIIRNAGVAAIPLSAFYQKTGQPHFVRFCFYKQDSILDEAAARLKSHFT